MFSMSIGFPNWMQPVGKWEVSELRTTVVDASSSYQDETGLRQHPHWTWRVPMTDLRDRVANREFKHVLHLFG